MYKERKKIMLQLLKYRHNQTLTWPQLYSVACSIYDKRHKAGSEQYMKAYYDGWKIDYKFDKDAAKLRRQKLNSILESDKPYCRRKNEY